MSSPSWRFVVEAEASKPYDAAQLVQQYALDRLGEHRQLRTFYILVGPTLGPPLRLKTDIRRIWRQHERKLSSGNADLDHFLTHLLWIGWGDIEGIFRRAAAEVDLNEALILLDAAEFLGAQGYRDVEPPWHAVQASQRRMALLSALVEALHRADSLDVEILERVVAARDALERLGQLQRPHLDGTQGAAMKELDPAIGLALQATKSIQDWCESIIVAVERQVELTEDMSTRRLHPLGTFLPLSLPAWVGIAIAAKNTVWRADGEPPQIGGYFLISFQPKAGFPWQVQMRWGVLKDVKRTRGRAKVFEIYRQILDSVNRTGKGPIKAPQAAGTATMETRTLVEVMDRTAIQRLAEDVAQDLIRARP